MEKTKIKIPNKSLFKTEEVCDLIDIKPYVLRFWESEFSEIRPLKSSTGQRMYEYKHIEILLGIKKLLLEDKMTVSKVKRELKYLFGNKEKPKTLKKVKNAFPAKNLAQRRGQGKHLSDEAMNKLAAAKSKLQELMQHTQNVCEKNNW